MKVGVCYLVNDGNSINMAESVPDALRRMGHEVLEAVAEFNQYPTPEWNSLNLLIVLEAEHYWRLDKWEWLSVPKALWNTETAARVDLHFEEKYDIQKRISPHRFFPALQDASAYGGTWLPHGVDTEIYRPLGIPKIHNIGYFGHIYEKRVPFWNAVKASGLDVEVFPRTPGARYESFTGLARTINQCKVILALPAYSHSFTTRPLECFACGVPCIVPRLPEFARCNEAQWTVGTPCYYEENDMASLHRACLEAETRTVEQLRAEAMNHRIEAKLQKIIDTVSP